MNRHIDMAQRCNPGRASLNERELTRAREAVERMARVRYEERSLESCDILCGLPQHVGKGHDAMKRPLAVVVLHHPCMQAAQLLMPFLSNQHSLVVENWSTHTCTQKQKQKRKQNNTKDKPLSEGVIMHEATQKRHPYVVCSLTIVLPPYHNPTGPQGPKVAQPHDVPVHDNATKQACHGDAIEVSAMRSSLE